MAKKTCGLKMSGLKTLLFVVPVAILGYLLYKHLNKKVYREGLDSKAPSTQPTPPTPPTSPTSPTSPPTPTPPTTSPTPPIPDNSKNKKKSTKTKNMVDYAKLDPNLGPTPVINHPVPAPSAPAKHKTQETIGKCSVNSTGIKSHYVGHGRDGVYQNAVHKHWLTQCPTLSQKECESTFSTNNLEGQQKINLCGWIAHPQGLPTKPTATTSKCVANAGVSSNNVASCKNYTTEATCDTKYCNWNDPPISPTPK